MKVMNLIIGTNRSISYDVQIGTSSVDSNINRILIDNNESPHLTLIRGFTYVFQVDLDSMRMRFLYPLLHLMKILLMMNGQVAFKFEINQGIFVFQVPMDAPNILLFIQRNCMPKTQFRL